MTEVLVGTKKGLFVLDGDAGAGFEVTARAFPGQAVEYAMRDPRSGRYLASVTSWFYGGRIWVTDDPAGEWQEARARRLPEDGDASLARIWVIAAGEADGDCSTPAAIPGCLFESHDGGLTWALNRGLWDHPTRPDWTPGGGGLCLHTIAPWPGDPDRLMVAISAVGVWLSDDRGATLALLEQRHRPRVPARGVARRRRPSTACTTSGAQAARPERLFMQFHGGVYRSDDAGASWIDVGDGTDLPSDFGFPIVVDPGRPRQRLRDPADRRRGPDDARRLRPCLGDARRRRDVGAARRRDCRSSDAYLTVLREAFDSAGRRPGPRALLRRHVGRGVRLR